MTEINANKECVPNINLGTHFFSLTIRKILITNDINKIRACKCHFIITTQALIMLIFLGMLNLNRI